MEAMVWEGVMELTKWAQEKKTDPLLWSIQVSAALNSAGVSLPSVDLAHRLISYICFDTTRMIEITDGHNSSCDNHVPLAWKLLEKAMAVRILPPLLALSLLSTRVLPYRHLHPAAYALYIDLLNRHAFSLSSRNGSMKDVLKLGISTMLEGEKRKLGFRIRKEKGI
ncbi:hypothetical protein VIGAN_09096700 [Vigna angularis var. angularis]|uniref:Uncharacterized protein n=1 Tax=Vigna angularis var. angularis TaxID=157739 RepID=A0A0S3SXK2_PHAAN|nr:hypothetical protein VIGAN_09096700 [Vigna angularis var. angularis]